MSDKLGIAWVHDTVNQTLSLRIKGSGFNESYQIKLDGTSNGVWFSPQPTISPMSPEDMAKLLKV